MKLHYHPMSQNARKAYFVAHYLGQPLTTHLVDIAKGEGKNASYLQLNPNGKVPTLEDGDYVLWESNAICNYIALKKPGNSLYPSDPRITADVNRWQSWELAHWAPTLFIFYFENMIKQFTGAGAADPAQLERGRRELDQYGGVLEAHLASRSYLVGNQLTLADVSVASHLMHTEMGKLPLENFPNIRRWFADFQQSPSWQAWHSVTK